MRLVIDARTATDHFPGIGRYVISLSHALSQIAPDLCISLLYDSSATTSCLALPDLPRIACPVSPFSIRQQWIVPKQLHRAKAILYHSPYYLMPYIPGVPTVLTCYDLIPLIYSQYFSALQRLIFRIAHAFALKTADRIIAISQTTKADLIIRFRLAPQRITVIPGAADAYFQPQSHDRIAAVRRRYALPEKYVLYVGSNKPHKNLQRLIEAWKIAECGMRNAECKLVIAGHWDERYPEAKKRTEELALTDHVIFAGPVEDSNLPALYSGAQLFVFPSLYEGFGLPVIEAMACGVPVLCSSVSSLPEVTGDAALLVGPLDVNSLAAAMNRLLADKVLRREMSRKGLVQAGKFSWERTARETVNVYTGVVNQ